MDKKDGRINLSKFLITVILTLVVLIGLKSNLEFKTNFYKKVFEDHFSFVTVNEWYKKYFGTSLPFQDLWKEKTKPVFAENLKYSNQSMYQDGVALTVEDNYLVPILDGGMVVFIGEKENYGTVVIIEQVDGMEVWYGNLSNVSVKLYDYVEKGNLLGEVDGNTLYLVFKKDGKILKYEDQI